MSLALFLSTAFLGLSPAFGQTPEEIRNDLNEQYVRSLQAGRSHEDAASYSIESLQERAVVSLAAHERNAPNVERGKQLFFNQFKTPFYTQGCRPEELHSALITSGLDYLQKERMFMAAVNSEKDASRLLWLGQTWIEEVGKTGENFTRFDDKTTPLRAKLKMRSRFQFYDALIHQDFQNDQWVGRLAEHVHAMNRPEGDGFLQELGIIKNGKYRSVVTPLRRSIAEKAIQDRADNQRRRAQHEAERPARQAAVKQRDLNRLKATFDEALERGLSREEAWRHAHEVAMQEGVGIMMGDMRKEVEAEFNAYAGIDEPKVADPDGSCPAKIAAGARAGLLGRLIKVFR